MKKILFLLLLIGCYFGAVAQVGFNSRIKGVDTLTNTTTDTAALTVRGNKAAVAFQVNAIKLTGTIAATSAIDYYGSVDGVNYGLLATDSMNTNASKVYSKSWNYNGYTKYRVIVRAAGTQTSSYSIWALYR